MGLALAAALTILAAKLEEIAGPLRQIRDTLDARAGSDEMANSLHDITDTHALANEARRRKALRGDWG